MRKNFCGFLGSLIFAATRLVSRARPIEPRGAQAVILHFHYGSMELTRLSILENKLEKAIAETKAGIFDGNEVATDGSDAFLYMYGPDADKLYRAIEPILKNTDFLHGAEVIRRYGPPGTAREVVSVLA
jgi:hypothetical protein